MNAKSSRQIFACRCPRCQYKRRFAATAIGKQADCKSCGMLFRIDSVEPVVETAVKRERGRRHMQFRDHGMGPSKGLNTRVNRDEPDKDVTDLIERPPVERVGIASLVIMWFAVITAAVFVIATVAWIASAIIAFHASGMKGATIGVAGMILTTIIGVFDVALILFWSDTIERMTVSEATSQSIEPNSRIPKTDFSLN